MGMVCVTSMKKLSLTALAVALVATSSYATTLGINPAPLQDPATWPQVGYALWDTFTDADPTGGFAFSNANPGAFDTDIFTAKLSAISMTGGSAAGGGDRIYNGVGPNSAAFNLAINGTVTAFSIDTITLQIKMTPPDVATGLTRLTFFTVTLNGQSVTPVQTNANTGDPLIGGQALGVIQYTWTGLNLNQGDAFNFSITSPASGHVSVDALRVDASVVPEPTTGMLLGLGLVTLALKRRQRR